MTCGTAGGTAGQIAEKRVTLVISRSFICFSYFFHSSHLSSQLPILKQTHLKLLANKHTSNYSQTNTPHTNYHTANNHSPYTSPLTHTPHASPCKPSNTLFNTFLQLFRFIFVVGKYCAVGKNGFTTFITSRFVSTAAKSTLFNATRIGMSEGRRPHNSGRKKELSAAVKKPPPTPQDIIQAVRLRHVHHQNRSVDLLQVLYP